MADTLALDDEITKKTDSKDTLPLEGYDHLEPEKEAPKPTMGQQVDAAYNTQKADQTRPGQRIVRAFKDFYNNPGFNQGAQSLHDTGGALAEAASPFLVPAMAANPVGTGAAILASGIAKPAVTGIAKILHAPNGVSELAGDAAGMAAGGIGGKIGSVARDAYLPGMASHTADKFVEGLPIIGKGYKAMKDFRDSELASQRSVFSPQTLDQRSRPEDPGRSVFSPQNLDQRSRTPDSGRSVFTPQTLSHTDQNPNTGRSVFVPQTLDTRSNPQTGRSVFVPQQLDTRVRPSMDTGRSVYTPQKLPTEPKLRKTLESED